jgi:hypothetical protein
MKKGGRGHPFVWRRSTRAQAAFSHIAVSNALLINGMLVPKLEFAAAAAFEVFDFVATPSLPLPWATSVARSHDPISWERATEKSRNT